MRVAYRVDESNDGMRVLITGGIGYIGYALVKVLLEDDTVTSIVLYDNFIRANYRILEDGKLPSKVKIVRGDILDRDKLGNLLQGVDIVCHMAAVVRAPFNEEFSHLFEQVNHWGTAELTSLLTSSSVRKLIYLSSGSVYGAGPEPFAVDSDTNPITPYGFSKLNGEKQVARLQHHMQVVVLRLGNVFGMSPGMHYGSVINRFNLAMRFEEPLLAHGSGNQLRPYIHIGRVTRAIHYFLREQQSTGIGTYNIYDFNLSINSILDAYRARSLAFEVIYVNQNQRLSDLTLSDNELLHELIGKPENFESVIA